MKNEESSPGRTCKVCGTEFTPNNAKQIYCTNRCRKANYLKHQDEQAQKQAHIDSQRTAELNQLKAAPRKPSQPAGVVNAEWQVLDQAYQTLAVQYQEKQQQKEQIDQAIRKLTGPGPGFWWGAGIGAFVVLLIMALYYEARRRQRLGIPFWLTSLGSLALLGRLGSVLGGWVADELESDDEKQQLTDQLDELSAARIALTDWLIEVNGRLEALASARDKIAKFGPPGPTPPDEAPLPPTDQS
ncbi:hypothetical protein [Spirosoma arcticum]